MSPAQLLTAAQARLRRATGAVRDAGASALEFAIIAAVVVVASSVIGAVVYNIVKGKSDDLKQCASVAQGSDCSGGGSGGGGLAP